MHRLFVGIEIPEVVTDALTMLQDGVDGARWRLPEQFHLTLVFIGDADRHGLEDAIEALGEVEAPPFELTLSGVGFFGGRRPRALWAGVAPSPELSHLQAKLETRLRRAGFELEKRKFTPHVTLAYLKDVPQSVAAQYSTEHSLFSCGPFPIDVFHLYSSHLGGERSHYEIEASYELSSSR